jgi:thiamine biosynthesis lipoprotein
LRRRWTIDGVERHHLVDPRTGAPSTSDLVHVTVVAARAWVAEVLAKAVLLRGSPHHFDLLGGTGAEALAVDRNGVTTVSQGFGAFTGDLAPSEVLIP